MNPHTLNRIGWMTTLLVLTGVVGGIASVMDTLDKPAPALPAPELPVVWGATAPAYAGLLPEVRIGPIGRPTIAVEDVISRVDDEPTDEELRAQLQLDLSRRFPLVLIAWSEEHIPSAFVRTGGRDVHLLVNDTLDRHGADARVQAIAADHIVLDAAPEGKPHKRFHIVLTLQYVPPPSLHWSVLLPGRAPRTPGSPNDDGLQLKSNTQEPYEIPEELLKRINADELARYVRVVPGGLQVDPELPEKSVLRELGARGGEIVKSINGQAVRSIADARTVIRAAITEGAAQLVIKYERDGVPATRVIQLPKKG